MSDSSSTLDRTTSGARAASVSPERAARMAAAFDAFEAMAMPTGRDEHWKYVDLDFDLATVPLADGTASAMAAGSFLSGVADRSGSVTIVDGAVIEAESSDRLRIDRLADLEAAADGELFPLDRDKFVAGRAAFGTDGVRVVVADGVDVELPVVIDVQAVSEGASFPTIDVHVGQNASIPVVVVYRSAPGVAAILSPQVGLSADTGGRIAFVGVQTLDHAATVVVHQRATLGRDATVRLGEVGLGGALGRLDLVVDHVGDGSSSEVVGVYFGEGDQTLDYRMVLHHQGKRTSSDVLLKGAVEDRAQSVFTGLLKIDRDATRTSAFETNRNLVLSEEAKAHSVPNLEILCDDVVCGHGSSVGPLEEEHLYYLLSRGLPKEKAEQLLIRGFFNEIIDRLPVAGLGDAVADEVFGRFVAAQEEGRL